MEAVAAAATAAVAVAAAAVEEEEAAVVATDLTAHLGGTGMQSDKATDDKPAKAEPPRCPYCGTTEAPIFVRAHLECPKCHTVTESCCDGGRCG